jgi:formylglycine-generating enzyme required for sulfatase activity
MKNVKPSAASLALVFASVAAGFAEEASPKDARVIDDFGRTITLSPVVVNEVRASEWKVAQGEGFELLSDVDDFHAGNFGRRFAQYLRYLADVCPAAMLPSGTPLTVVLATPPSYEQLVPRDRSKEPGVVRPMALMLRSPDRAMLVVEYGEVESRWSWANGSAGAIRQPLNVALRNAATGYIGFSFPLTEGSNPATRSCYALSIDRGVPALLQSPGQPALREGLGRILSVFPTLFSPADILPKEPASRIEMAGRFPLRRQLIFEYYRTFHFPQASALPPIAQLFAVGTTSPAWGSPLHQLERDAFVHWAMFADNGRHRSALIDFLRRVEDEPVNEQMVRASFGLGFAELQDAITRYVKIEPPIDPDQDPLDAPVPLGHRFFETQAWFDPRPAPALPTFSEPTPEQESRIIGDIYRLEDRAEQAFAEIEPRLHGKVRSPELLFTMGMILHEAGRTEQAAACLVAAARIGLGASAPFYYNARWLLHERLAARTRLPEPTARQILSLLNQARALPPARPDVYEALADLWENVDFAPSADDLAALEDGIRLYPDRTDLVERTAKLRRKFGYQAEADELIHAVLDRTFVSAKQVRLRELASNASRAPAGRPAEQPGAIEPASAPASLRPPPAGAGAPRTIVSLGLDLIWVKPGSVILTGPDASDRPDAIPGRAVTAKLTRGFWLGKYEVTQKQWTAVMHTTLEQQRQLECRDLPTNGSGPGCPMYFVSWDEAMEFCRRLTESERKAGRLAGGLRFTLPTEAQWEYACRAGSTDAFAGRPADVARYEVEDMRDVEIGRLGWGIIFADRFLDRWLEPRLLAKVGAWRPNAWGFYDMHGGVAEWCADWYAPLPSRGEFSDPVGPATGAYRVVRGGNSVWGSQLGIAALGSGARGRDLPSARFGYGFRVALVEEP